MFCTKCGTKVPDEAKFCPTCGSSKEEIVTGEYKERPTAGINTNSYGYGDAPYTSYNQGNSQDSVPGYQQSYYNSDHLFKMDDSPIYVNTKANYHSMTWYKVLIYFYLILAIVVHLIGGVICMTGKQYDLAGDAKGISYITSISDLVYVLFPGLKTVDIIYGLILIGLAIFAYVVRQGLVDYKADAPKMLNIYMGISIIVSIFYGLIASNIIGVGFFDIVSARTAVSILLEVVMICCNFLYFRNREDVFCN